MSDILAQIDAAIEDAEGYVEWHGSADSAEWHADGSHEVQIGGHYYATDRPSQHHLVERPMSRGGICGERDIARIERFEAYLPSRALADLARREQACASLAAIVPRDELPGVTAAIEQAALMMGAATADSSPRPARSSTRSSRRTR